ncbi:hypothetical protein OF897_06985 [Chryseobacterium formosus]|uniref:Uncharacterized protein n=1 Tax=Chryseobacterium formosus TaxID=1537363 RepID=A0ABT3XRW4_9FLAO|nr:hypothetical protein [Chryseobacterium formosus]MCX8523665.1 hypothetical protein [Chryseobacterium formosus]
MEIKYTSMNDVYANYVFNYQDNIKGIQQINDFAEKDIQESKKVRDSIMHHIQNLTKEEAYIYISSQSLPTSAENILFYKAVESFKRGPENLLIEYELDEDNFRIKDIHIPKIKSTNFPLIVNIKEQNSGKSILKIDKVDFTMQEMRLLKEEIDKLGYHKNLENYVYEIININDSLLMTFLFEQKGKYFKLDFDNK